MTKLLDKTKSEMIEMIKDLFDKNKHKFSKKSLLLIYLDIEKRIDRNGKGKEK